MEMYALIIVVCIAVLVLVVRSVIKSVEKAKEEAIKDKELFKKELQERHPMEYARLVWFFIGVNRDYLAFRWMMTLNPSPTLLEIEKYEQNGIKYLPDIPIRYEQLKMTQDDVDFLERYSIEHKEEYERFTEESYKTLVRYQEAFARNAATAIELQLNSTVKEMYKGKEKSAAGAMLKGAVVGKVIGGDAGAVVGAMVAKEKHDSKNK